MDPFDLLFVLGFPRVTIPVAIALWLLAWAGRSKLVAIAAAVVTVGAVYEALTWSLWSSEAIRVDLVLLAPALLGVAVAGTVVGVRRLAGAGGRPEVWT